MNDLLDAKRDDPATFERRRKEWREALARPMTREQGERLLYLRFKGAFTFLPVGDHDVLFPIPDLTGTEFQP